MFVHFLRINLIVLKSSHKIQIREDTQIKNVNVNKAQN